MKGKVSCFHYLCQSNTSLRNVCCRGHLVCFIRNREMESGKGQNIPQADYLVFEQELRGTNTSLLIQLTSTSIFTQAVISFWLRRLFNHWIQKICHSSVVICWSRNCPHLSGTQVNRGQDPAQDLSPAPCWYVLSLAHEGHPWVKMGTVSTKTKSQTKQAGGIFLFIF